MTISKREKFLIFFLVLVALVLVFVMLIILPTQQKITDNKQLRTDLQFKQQEIQTKIALQDTLIEKQKDKLIALNDEFAKIEDPLDAAQYERRVLPLAYQHKMRINSANLGAVQTATPDAKQVLISEPSYRIKELVLEYLKEEEIEDFIPTSDSILLKQSHTYNVLSTFNNYKSFLDEITNWRTSVFVTGSNYNFENQTATFAFDVYTIAKIEEAPHDETLDSDYVGGSDSYWDEPVK